MSSLAIASPAQRSTPAPSTPVTPAHPRGHPPPDTAEEPAPIEDEEQTAEQIAAARRARRQALLAQYQDTAAASTPPSGGASAPAPILEGGPSSTNPPSHTQEPPISDHITQNGAGEPDVSQDTGARQSSACRWLLSLIYLSPLGTPEETSSQGDFSLAKVTEEGPAQDESEQISAADYDPNQDRRDEELRRVKQAEPLPSNAMEVDVEEEVEEEVEDEDDVDDMFAAIADKPKKTKKVRDLQHRHLHWLSNIRDRCDG